MDISTLLPTVPSERTRMTMMRGIVDDEYIVYKADDGDEIDRMSMGRKEKLAWAHCTACDRDMLIQRVTREVSTGYGCSYGVEQGLSDEYGNYWPGDTMLCPICGEVVRLMHVSRLEYHTCVNLGWCEELIRVGGQAVVVIWGVKRWLSKFGQTGYDWMPGEAYTVEEYETPKRRTKKTRLVKYSACSRSASARISYTFNGVWNRLEKARLIMPYPDCVVEPEEGVTAGTPMEKSGIEAYMRECGEYADRLMAVWLKHNNVENIAVQAPNILACLLGTASHREITYYRETEVGDAEVSGIDWTKVRPHEMLGLEKDEMRRIEEEKPGEKKFRAYMTVRRETGERLTGDLLDMMINNDLIRSVTSTVERIAGNGAKVEKVLKYCSEQRRADKRVTVMELLDTWDMLTARLGRLTTDVMWPRDLMRTHDRECEIKKGLAAEAYDESIHRRFTALSEYSWDDKLTGLCIRPAASGTELRMEGKKLHHCVETYCERVAAGRTAIFLIRKRSRRQEAYYTLELNEKDMTVVQNRGMRNCDRTPEVEDFEKRWLEYARKIKEGNKDGKACCYGA